jgi:two-component system NtrC family sensor kinase
LIVNLVVNANQALQENPASRRIVLRTRHVPGEDRAILEVADSGPGIPPEIRARIFEPFFTTKRSGSGTGLGLALCRGIVEGHGGSIQVESELGRDTTFRVTLPIRPPPAMALESPPPEGVGPITGRRILVVDDEQEVASVLADILRLDDHQVAFAANGLLALEKLRERPYDAILCDMRMPDLDGPGLYRALAQDPGASHRRMIFLTGDTLDANTRVFLEQTNAPRLAKPFTVLEVRGTVQRLLGAATP